MSDRKGVSFQATNPSIRRKAGGTRREASISERRDTKVVGDTLEGMVREGARRMLAAALKEEVSAFPGQGPL